jgi:hypothetical protein
MAMATALALDKNELAIVAFGVVCSSMGLACLYVYHNLTFVRRKRTRR